MKSHLPSALAFWEASAKDVCQSRVPRSSKWGWRRRVVIARIVDARGPARQPRRAGFAPRPCAHGQYVSRTPFVIPSPVPSGAFTSRKSTWYHWLVPTSPGPIGTL